MSGMESKFVLNDGVTEAVDLCMAQHSETACYSVDD